MSVYICKLYTDYSRCQFRNRSLNPQTVTPPMREIPMRKCLIPQRIRTCYTLLSDRNKMKSLLRPHVDNFIFK